MARSYGFLSAVIVAGSFVLGSTPAVVARPEVSDPTASRAEAFDNPTAHGSRKLSCRIWYPQQRGSSGIAPGPARGRSSVVFLHGRGGFALVYTALARRLAARGFLVCASDTARTDPVLQREDGAALFAALGRANEIKGSFWYHAFDMRRVGLAGHSMGGGSTAYLLSRNLGYRAGFAFAPWQGGIPFSSYAARIRAPFGIIQGQGDRTLPWRETGKVLFEAIPQRTEKFLYLVNEQMTHQNAAVLLPFARKRTREIFEASAKLCGAFFAKHLDGEAAELTKLLRQPNGDPRLVQIYRSPRAAVLR